MLQLMTLQSGKNHLMEDHQMSIKKIIFIIILLNKIGGVLDLTVNNLKEELIIVHFIITVYSIYLEERILVLAILTVFGL